MGKEKFFRANESFVDYIQMIGFQHRHVDSEKQYYVNSKGNQIRIDYESGIIALLNSRGNVVDYSSTFTNNQIDNFARKDN
jgi:hypothetical protein